VARQTGLLRRVVGLCFLCGERMKKRKARGDEGSYAIKRALPFPRRWEGVIVCREGGEEGEEIMITVEDVTPHQYFNSRFLYS